MPKKHDYNTFKELFDIEIHYAYEPNYPPVFGVGCSPYYDNTIVDDLYVTFHKLTIYSSGYLEYKGNYQTYDPRLWPKVKAFAEMLIETKAEKILLKKKKRANPRRRGVRRGLAPKTSVMEVV
jgi:hypothetical protein